MTKPLFLQLWTLRDEMKEDFAGTIQAVADMGYVGVEPIGMKLIPHSDQNPVYKKHNLKVLSFHCSNADLLGEGISNLIQDAKTYGAKYIITGVPPRKEDFLEADKIVALALAYNRAGGIAAKHGLKVGFHNHDWEMAVVNGKPAIEIFLENINDNVIVELDTYWAKVGGACPVTLIQKYAKQIPLIHIKDGPVTKGEPMLPFGRGKLDIAEIVNAAKEVEAIIVELDDVKVTTHMQAVAESYTYMMNKKLAKGNK